MIANDIQTAFDDPKWANYMNSIFALMLQNGICPDDKNYFESQPIWANIKQTVNAIMIKNNIKTHTVTLSDLVDTCDGECLKAAFTISYLNESKIDTLTVDLYSEY